MPFVKVTQISRLVTEDNLRELFQCCGEIQELKVIHTTTEQECVVEFRDGHNAETAVMISGTELGDSQLIVKHIDEREALKFLRTSNRNATSRTEYEAAYEKMKEMMQGPSNQAGVLPDEVKRTIYVGNLNRHCTGEQLRNLFSTVGEVLFVKFSGTAQFRYAFIEFATEEAARSSFMLHGTEIGGQAIKIGQAHNPIFKDDINTQDCQSSIREARRAAQDLNDKFTTKGSERGRERDYRERDRDRRSPRRRRRRSDRRRRRRSRSESPKQEMFWDGFQWHTNKEHKVDDIESHVTSIIQDKTESKLINKVDPAAQMESEAMKALKALQQVKAMASI